MLYDASGNTVLTAKKFPLSLAKWTVTTPSGRVAAKTRTISGLAKYGVEVDVPGAPRNGSQSTFTIVPELSNSKVIIMQVWRRLPRGRRRRVLCQHGGAGRAPRQPF